jgi:hypothetical protein
MPPVFLLSPAHSGGRRARILLGPNAEFALARRLREPGGITLGEAYAFMSGLYFRGKLAYALAFGGATRTRVIAPGLGLVEASRRVTPADLAALAEVPVEIGDPRYREPLERDARALGADLAAGAVVLLGSIATDKYVGVLLLYLGERLLFPSEFVGRGDMSRGGLLLRAVDAGRELEYRPVLGAPRRGARPPKLEPLRRSRSPISGP